MERLSLLLASTVLFSPFAFASGELDSSFGDNGTLVVHSDLIAPNGDEGVFDGLVDHAGRYVSFGTADYKPEGYFYNVDDFVGKVGMITRHLPDGTPDTAFGINGVSYQQVSGYFLEWRVAAEQTDGKLLVAGNQTSLYGPSDPPAIICRFEQQGGLDKKFGLNGCRWLEFPLVEEITYAIALDIAADGSIVVLGTSYGVIPFAVARMNADGSNDKCFGDADCEDGGLVHGPQELADIDVRAIVVQPSGGIVIAGNREDKLDPNDPDDLKKTYTSVAFRLSTTGKHDTTFGIGGIAEFDASGFFPGKIVDQNVGQMLSDHDGGLVIAGYVTPDPGLSSAVMLGRMTATGALDPGFSGGGVGIAHFDGKALMNWASALSMQSDGKLLIAGTAEYDDQSWRLGVMRFLADGTPDQHFGTNGSNTFPTAPNLFWNSPTSIASSNERIVIFGNSAMEIQDFNPTLVVLDRDALFGDAFENMD